ncbi:MAG TPA: 16S rRNA (guanine(527)-N(7))-methyltransferase RsmG, partial [Actinobacteria bacterium]|nr:16S rRNA (guanine(527)-N(7))-methyltransferase RsmG [Actinomycetes bacterium]HEX21728.1 16S rRNA (guanine(527)-N(7))-methyltransferase RsmG [Actinomycetota bacterium]
WLQEQVKTLGIDLSSRQLSQFKKYQQLLTTESAKFNLMSIDEKRLLPDHFLDSLSVALCKCLFKNCRLTDIGSGAGFPGIPLKIAFPEVKLIMVESRRKRAEFLELLISKLELKKTSVIRIRAEEAGRAPDFRRKNNIVVARAVAELSVLLEYALPLLSVGGWFVALKGPKGVAEAKDAEGIANILGGETKDIISVKLIPNKVRNLILIQKVRETPERWPRRTGVPGKRPLKAGKLLNNE